MPQRVRSPVNAVVAYFLTVAFSLGFAQDTPKKYALLIGITRYDHAAMNGNEPLKYPEADAKAIGELLASFGYEVDLLLGSRATRTEIVRKLDGLRSKSNSNGISIVGFFGHGVEVYENKKNEAASIVGCFCPFDAEVQPQLDGEG